MSKPSKEHPRRKLLYGLYINKGYNKGMRFVDFMKWYIKHIEIDFTPNMSDEWTYKFTDEPNHMSRYYLTWDTVNNQSNS